MPCKIKSNKVKYIVCVNAYKAINQLKWMVSFYDNKVQWISPASQDQQIEDTPLHAELVKR